MVEAKDDAAPTDDPFAKAKHSKQERQAKNELQRLRNIAKSKNIKLPKVGLPTRDYFPSSQQLSEALTIARTSTASVGKFQSKYVSLSLFLTYCYLYLRKSHGIIYLKLICIYVYIIPPKSLNNLKK